MDENNNVQNGKTCYFWKVYKYFVPVEQITLRGWVIWCEELYQLKHGKKRSNRIYVDPNMKKAMVKARLWDKAKVEKWLNDHGYTWSCQVETRYQYDYTKEEGITLIDADAKYLKRLGPDVES